MPMTDHKKRETEAVELLSDLIARAERAGAGAADAVFIAGASLSVTQRLGKREELERAESQDLGLPRLHRQTTSHRVVERHGGARAR